MDTYNENLHHHASPSIYENARALRRLATPAEEILWKILRNRQLFSLKFRRQHPFSSYILDFYCHELKLCIEADGDIHLEKDIAAYDLERTRFLRDHNIHVLRFTNEQILQDITSVVNAIELFIIYRQDSINR